MRFSGAVGYATSTETAPGVWTDVITEVTYFGDVVRNARRLEPSPQVPMEEAGRIALENSFSIVADANAYENFLNMKYVQWMQTNWTITAVEVRRPRLILTVGEVWNGPTA